MSDPDHTKAETEVRVEMEILASATDLNLSGAIPLHFTLEPTKGLGSDLGTILEAIAPGRQLFLVLRDFSAEQPPGVLYAVYLGLPTGAEIGPDDSRHVGTINFFGAIPSRSGFYSFDISRSAQTLRDQGLLASPVTITVVPLGTPSTGARPVIGRAELVLQRASLQSSDPLSSGQRP